MLHLSILPVHGQFSALLSNLKYVVMDEVRLQLTAPSDRVMDEVRLQLTFLTD
jgi:hypothetical protein